METGQEGAAGSFPDFHDLGDNIVREALALDKYFLLNHHRCCLEIVDFHFNNTPVAEYDGSVE